MSRQSYRELIAWQKAMDWVERVYRATYGWPKEDLYGLSSQLRRAAVSVPANVAEGQGRDSAKDFLRHVTIADGSLHEIETLLLVAQRLDYFDASTCETLLRQAAEVGRLLHGLKRALHVSDNGPSARRATQELRNSRT